MIATRESVWLGAVHTMNLTCHSRRRPPNTTDRVAIFEGIRYNSALFTRVSLPSGSPAPLARPHSTNSVSCICKYEELLEKHRVIHDKTNK